MPSYDDIYIALGAVLKEATGRAWWRKGGIQSQPTGTYATIFLTRGVGVQNDVVDRIPYAQPTEDVDTQEKPWGTVLAECQVEFLRSADNDSAMNAATRFKNSLSLEKRYTDLWGIIGLVGGVDVLDISALFRTDTEPRARVSFQFYANISDPAPLTGTDAQNIAFQSIDVVHTRQDGEILHVPVDVDNSQVPV